MHSTVKTLDKLKEENQKKVNSFKIVYQIQNIKQI